jgi:ubiquinone biosynthesis protein COQ4
MNHAFPRFDLKRAVHALSAILKNPDDLPQVFVIIDSLSGTAPQRLARKLERSVSGARLLRHRPDIVPMLTDRAALRALPAGTLGRAYLDFVESEGISPQGIRDASVAGETSGPLPPAVEYVHGRMRDTHDLWHAVTGYKGDVVGELALLAFTLAQHWNTAVAFIVAGGVLKGFGGAELRLLWDGYRRGRAAAWLPGVEWESLLATPIEVVRRELRLGAPREYTPVRTAELRAEGLIA